jgi:hypothetical protein
VKNSEFFAREKLLSPKELGTIVELFAAQVRA